MRSESVCTAEDQSLALLAEPMMVHSTHSKEKRLMCVCMQMTVSQHIRPATYGEDTMVVQMGVQATVKLAVQQGHTCVELPLWTGDPTRM